jgi:hypothetical protein
VSPGDGNRRRSARLGLVIAGVTALKAAVALAAAPRPVMWEDGQIAVNILQTGTFFYTHYDVANHSFQFPVYPLLVAGTFTVFTLHPAMASLLNLLLNGATAWVLARLFARSLDDMKPSISQGAARDAVVAASVGAFLVHPLINSYAIASVHPFTLDMLMLYVPVLMTFRYYDRGQRTLDLALVGVSLGLAILTRATLVVSALLFIILAAGRLGPWIALRRTLIVFGIAALVGAPWLIRNYMVDGIVGYTSTTSEILWKGALPNSEGSNFLADGRVYRDVLTVDERRLLSSLSVREQSAFFAQKYADIAADSPGHIVRMFFRKLRNFFWFRRQLGNTYGATARRFIPAYQLAYAGMLGLALVAIPLAGRPALLLWSLAAALGVMQAIFYVETRHRVVIEPLLIFLAVVTTFHAVAAWRRRIAR